MVSFMIKYKNVFLAVTILFFLGSLGFVGAGVFMEEYGPNAVVARVGGSGIKLKDFEPAYQLAERRLVEQGQEVDAVAQAALRQEVLQAMITEESLAQAAAAYGIGAADIEVGYDIRNSFSDGGGFNKEVYVWLVRNQFGMNPNHYEAMIKRQKLAEKFKLTLLGTAMATPQEAAFLVAGQSAAGEDASIALLAASEVKAQALANAFTRQYNEQGNIKLKHQELLFGADDLQTNAQN